MKTVILECAYSETKTFSLVRGSLLFAKHGCIVNPANGGLSHGGGLAELIAREAGSRLVEESDEVIDNRGLLKAGEAVATTAGNLPYEGVIHAVAPKRGSGNEGKVLAHAILNSLRIAEDRSWNPVAFPALGTGIFLISHELCAKAFNSAIPYYWAKRPESSIRKISLYVDDDAFETFHKILTKQPKWRSVKNHV